MTFWGNRVGTLIILTGALQSAVILGEFASAIPPPPRLCAELLHSLSYPARQQSKFFKVRRETLLCEAGRSVLVLISVWAAAGNAVGLFCCHAQPWRKGSSTIPCLLHLLVLRSWRNQKLACWGKDHFGRSFCFFYSQKEAS